MPRLPALLLLAGLVAACRPPEGPAERYRRFAEAARAGRAADVWAMLSERSRRAITAEGRALAEPQPPRAVDLTGPALVLGDLSATAPKVKSVTPLRESADAAVVAVEEEGGGRGEVSLSREGGEWRVDLPGAG